MPEAQDGPIVLPQHAIEDLRLQRTGYRDWGEEDILRHYTGALDGFSALLRRHRLAGPARQSVLDIGCGIGFCLMAFARAFGADHDFTGIDRDDRSTLFYGFAEKAASYNALSTTRDVLSANGISAARLLDADRDGFPDGLYDTVMSTLAYGFHFPVSVYLDCILATTRPGAVLVTDIRKGTDGAGALARHFERVEVVDFPKYERSVFVRR